MFLRSSMLTKRADCFDPSPVITQTDRMNVALNSSGPGFILSLCPSTNYTLVAPVNFAFPNQEISTQGYPTGDQRAFLIVGGPVSNGTGHTTAIQGTCANCDGTQIRNIQVSCVLFVGESTLQQDIDRWNEERGHKTQWWR